MHPPVNNVTAAAIAAAGGGLKYLQIIALNAGVETDITTTLTAAQKPYAIHLFDENAQIGGRWDDISDDVEKAMLVVGGVWHIFIWSTDALTNVELKIIY